MRNWELLARCAPAQWQVRSVALPDGAASLADQEAFIAELLAGSPSPVTLVGHSLGAYLAARALACAGDRVERAVLIGGFARLPSELAARHAGLVDALARGEIEGEARHELIRDLTVAPDEASEPGWTLVADMLCAPTGPDLARMVRRGIASADASVEAFDTPALVIHGTEDRAVPLALGEELAALGTQATLVAFQGAGHFLQMFHVEPLARLVFADGSAR